MGCSCTKKDLFKGGFFDFDNIDKIQYLPDMSTKDKQKVREVWAAVEAGGHREALGKLIFENLFEMRPRLILFFTSAIVKKDPAILGELDGLEDEHGMMTPSVSSSQDKKRIEEITANKRVSFKDINAIPDDLSSNLTNEDEPITNQEEPLANKEESIISSKGESTSYLSNKDESTISNTVEDYYDIYNDIEISNSFGSSSSSSYHSVRRSISTHDSSNTTWSVFSSSNSSSSRYHSVVMSITCCFKNTDNKRAIKSSTDKELTYLLFTSESFQTHVTKTVDSIAQLIHNINNSDKYADEMKKLERHHFNIDIKFRRFLCKEDFQMMIRSIDSALLKILKHSYYQGPNRQGMHNFLMTIYFMFTYHIPRKCAPAFYKKKKSSTSPASAGSVKPGETLMDKLKKCE